jgi:O-antigen biosynthesis protein
MLEITGERLLPERQQGELVHAEHLARYRFAAALAPGRGVLDVACGEGYGTAMLAEAGADAVAGVDIDQETVEHARRRYGLEFRRADIAELPFADASFELAVCFETIEHVPDGDRVLAELRRVLTDDGLLVVSTPNASEYLIGTEFHAREYEADEFVALLHRHFEDVRLAFQQNWLSSAVLGATASGTEGTARPLDADLYRAVAQASGQELYTVAVCGRGDHSSLRDVVVTTEPYEAHRLGAMVRDWQERAAESERLVGVWNARATESERLVDEWHARAIEAERQLDEARAAIGRIRASLSWRVTAPLRRLSARIRGREGA